MRLYKKWIFVLLVAAITHGVVVNVSATMQFLTGYECLKDSGYDQECAKKLDQTQATKYKKYFRDESGRLILFDDNGNVVADFLKSDGDKYYFQDLNQTIGYFLIDHDDGNEWGESILISMASKAQYPMSNVPLISPDGKRMVKASCMHGPVSYGGELETEVIRITKKELIREWYAPEGCFSKARWLTNEEIFLEGFVSAKETEKTKLAGHLRLKNGAWEYSPTK